MAAPTTTQQPTSAWLAEDDAFNTVHQKIAQFSNAAYSKIKANNEEFVDMYRCAIGVTDKAAQKYDFVAMWEPVKQEIEELLNHLQSCPSDQ